ncbi:MAG TPA: glycoside hydrolase family 30 beta sandwich domain-containing protein [Bryobacteraceae bacterium]|jgi:uncharacterized protein (TIGR03437 family)|nr:glycoside hydrolase family 30 beta sandwich domain-containing protein [Bryobacteraceae bacterium]
MPQRTDWWLRAVSLVAALAILTSITFFRPMVIHAVAAPNVTIQVDLSITYQKLEGFGQAEDTSLAATLTDPSLRAVAIDKAYHQVGINMGTIGTLLESPGSYDQRQNDNGDPFTINWAGFNPINLTQSKTFVIDLAKPFGFNDYYLGAEAPNVRWGSPWLAPIRQQNYSQFLDEAAEQVLANVSYWQSTYGEEPQYFQLGNEQETGNQASINPDLSGFGNVNVTQQIVDLVNRAGARLRAAGYLKTKFMVGTEETEEASYQVASAILADPQASQYVGAIGYHTYPYGQGYSSVPFILATSGSGVPDPSRIAIRNKIRDLAGQYNIGAWLTENSHGGVGSLSYDTFRARAIHIHDEFLYANAAAYFAESAMWDLASQMGHFGNTDLYSGDNEGNVVLIDNGTGRVDIAGIGYAIGHYARWAKPGSLRVDAQSSDPLVQVTAFRDDAAGRVVLVLINNSSAPTTATVNLNGTIMGTLTGEQSTPAAYWTPLPGLAPSSASSFQIALPATSVTSLAGAFTGGGSGTPPPPIPAQMSVVSSASYTAPVAADSIASILLPNLPITQGLAPMPLPLTLNGITVTVQDSAGTVRQAPLFYVSPNQVNIAVPPGTAVGSAVFSVNGSGTMASATATVASVAPGLFSANANGTGVAAAQIQRVHPDGTQSFDVTFQCSAPGNCQPIPLNLQPGQDKEVDLTFYGTGIRNRGSSDVVMKFGNTIATVKSAGPQATTTGLDQITVVAPLLSNSGDWNVAVTVSGVTSNTVTLRVQ